MKIIEVCPKYIPERGGIITQVKEIGERLAARGHTVEVFTTDPIGKLNEKVVTNGVIVRRFKTYRTASPRNVKWKSESSYGSDNVVTYSSFLISHSHCSLHIV